MEELFKYCKQCGSKFYKPANVGRSLWFGNEKRPDGMQYCSKECASKSLRKIKICKQCGREFYGRNKYFCSNVCSGKYTGFKEEHIGWNKGKKMSEEIRKRVSDGHKGQIPWNKGIVHEQIRGENHWNWQGGKDKKCRKDSLTYEECRRYLDWKKSVLKRDGWNCQHCGKHGGRLHVHHIKSWAKYPEKRMKLSNGLTLCPSCHARTDSYSIHVGKGSTDDGFVEAV